MGFEHISTEVDGHVATLWLNRPEVRNAMSEDMWADLPRALDDLATDPGVRAVVVAGRGPAFTVGIDVHMLAAFNHGGPSQASRNMDLYRSVKRLQATFSALAEFPRPVIAAVHGYCLGAGIDLITACDIRLASEDAIFSIRETRMGLVADVGTMQRLPRIVSPGQVAELAYTGKDIDARRAEKIGLVNDVYPDQESVVAAARDLAAEIASNSPFVVEGIKTVLRSEGDLSLDQALDHIALWNAAFIATNDVQEAMTAFFEKRSPQFSGD